MDYYNEGRTNYKNGNFNKAVNYFKKALDEDPKNLDYLYALGSSYSLLYDSESNFKKSLHYYNKVLEIEPTHIKALIRKSLLLAYFGEAFEGLKILKDCLEKSNNGYLWATKGRLLSYYHDEGDIENCFIKAFDSNEDKSYIYYQKARALENDLNYEDAIKCYDKSIEVVHENVCDLDKGILITKPEILLMKGWTYIRINKYEKALNCFDKILNINKKSITGLYSKAHVFTEQKDYETALNLLQHILFLDPEDIPSLVLKAIIYELQGSSQTAMIIYQSILDIDGSNGLALMNLSGHYNSEKEYEKSLNIAKKALEIEPMNAFALRFGSIAARKMGNLDLARKWEKNLSNPRVNYIFLEKNLQDKIVNEPWKLKKAGFNLSFYAREYNLKDGKRRLDLLYKDIKTDDYLVIELKIVPADKKAYKQIKDYMNSISQTIGIGRNVKGLVISFGYNEEFKKLIDNDPYISQINYDKLGLT